MRRFGVRTIGMALVVAVAVAACGVGGSEPGGYQPPAGGGAASSPEPDEPVTLTPDPGSKVHDVGKNPQRVEPRSGMANVRKVVWESFERRGPKALDIKYWSGVEPCNVLDHVEVDENDKRVVVTLFEGSDPEAGDVACIELALLKVVRVQLDSPLGARKVVDGAK